MPMTRLQYLLNKLAEEGAEVAQIAIKTAQFGLDEKCPGQQLTNCERCHIELNDLQAIVEMLNDEFQFGFAIDPGKVEIKKAKVNKYYDYSTSLGMVAGRRRDL